MSARVIINKNYFEFLVRHSARSQPSSILRRSGIHKRDKARVLCCARGTTNGSERLPPEYIFIRLVYQCLNNSLFQFRSHVQTMLAVNNANFEYFACGLSRPWDLRGRATPQRKMDCIRPRRLSVTSILSSSSSSYEYGCAFRFPSARS